jgi:hypothetical protein
VTAIGQIGRLKAPDAAAVSCSGTDLLISVENLDCTRRLSCAFQDEVVIHSRATGRSAARRVDPHLRCGRRMSVDRNGNGFGGRTGLTDRVSIRRRQLESRHSVLKWSRSTDR